MRSTSSAPAAIAPAASISPPARRCSRPPAACRWSSTATARSPAAPAAPTCCRRWACRCRWMRRPPGRCFGALGFTFLFAPYYHAATKSIAPVRAALGVRTVFNILGPLCNPAAPPYLVVGAFSTATAELMAQALVGSGVRARVRDSRRRGLGRADPDRRLHAVRCRRGRACGASGAPRPTMAWRGATPARWPAPMRRTTRASSSAVLGGRGSRCAPRRAAARRRAGARGQRPRGRAARRPSRARAQAIDSGAAAELLLRLERFGADEKIAGGWRRMSADFLAAMAQASRERVTRARARVVRCRELADAAQRRCHRHRGLRCRAVASI